MIKDGLSGIVKAVEALTAQNNIFEYTQIPVPVEGLASCSLAIRFLGRGEAIRPSIQ